MSEPITFARLQTLAERKIEAHVCRWGSLYAVVKRGRRWTWESHGVSAPTLYATKHEAQAAFERYLDVLSDCRRFELQTTGRYLPWYEAERLESGK